MTPLSNHSQDMPVLAMSEDIPLELSFVVQRPQSTSGQT